MAASALQTGYAPSGGTRIYFECAGSGAPLIFLHAGVSDSRMWDPQFDAFHETRRVVRYDHRSFGKSAWVEEPFAFRDDLLGEIKAPTLILIGDSDAEDLAMLADRMSVEIPGAKRLTIRNAAHLPSLEHPDEFNSILRDFLAGAEQVAGRSR